MNDEQLLRYSRHILLDEIGIEAQERLLGSTALVLGAGGLGSPAALYLAAAGVGRILLADGDTVDLTNLQRQILHTADRVGMAKTASASVSLRALNPGVEIIPLPRLDTQGDETPPAAQASSAAADCTTAPAAPADARTDADTPLATAAGQGPSGMAGTTAETVDADRPPTSQHASGATTGHHTSSAACGHAPSSPATHRLRHAVARADVVLDCSDNFATRHALNRACVQLRKPLVSGAAIRFDGQLSVFDTRQASSPCYHCLFPDGENVEEVRCSQMGVFAPLTGIIGTMQAAEALKLLGNFGTPMTGRLLLLDARTMRFTDIRVPRDPGCPVCGQRH